MTVTGRKPKPRHLKVAEGTYRPDRDKGGKGLPESVPNEPAWSRILPGKNAVKLRKEARAEWRRVVPVLGRARILNEVDRSLLLDYCVTWAFYLEAIEDIARRGQWLTVTMTNRSGESYETEIRNPSVKIALDLKASLKVHIAECGLGPSSRGRINIPGEPDDDELEREVFGDGPRRR